jgi:hypothetical protein
VPPLKKWNSISSQQFKVNDIVHISSLCMP